jgi:3-demethoxyubiquinol 3-hydroxylase
MSAARPALSPVDRVLATADLALRTLSGTAQAARPRPAAVGGDHLPLELPDRELSGSLMRVNHVGEVCAQALYTAQSLAARDPNLRRRFEAAAREETDHLAWTQQRLAELGARPSWLNPLWFAGSFVMGLVAGRAGDAASLGFVVETERQVEQHLEGHLKRLPTADVASRAILLQMKADEARHGSEAQAAGATPLPAAIRWGMRAVSRIMTTTAHHI